MENPYHTNLPLTEKAVVRVYEIVFHCNTRCRQADGNQRVPGSIPATGGREEHMGALH